jgi:transposase InsO family protein
MADSFWQIGLDEASKLKTAFSIPGRGLFHFKVLPFGLSNSAQCLGRLMDMVLNNEMEPNVFVYVDDIVICSEDLESHLDLLEKVAAKLVNAGLKANLDKSKFCKKELRYLGYVLDEQGLRTDPDKVSVVVNFPAPRTLKELRRFIGMCGWYRRFIGDFATPIAPMSELLKTKNNQDQTSTHPKLPQKFIWTKEADEAFRKAKEVLVSAPVLVNPNYEKPFVIHADASDIGVGGVLSQEQPEGGEKPCAYFSAKLSGAERKYTTTEKECLGVLLSIENFRPYVEGTKFTVVTDHSALLWLLKMKTPPSPRLARWILRLQGFDFEVIHRKGKEHVVPDTLSRIPDEKLELCLLDSNSSCDEWYLNLSKKICDNPEKYPEFRVEDNKIYKFCKSPNDFGDKDFLWKVVVPASLRTDIMQKAHEECGHLGVFKTSNRIRQRYYWPKLQEDVQAHIRNCDACKSSKDLRTTQRPPMGQQKIATRPWQIISMDFVGKFPRSTQQNTQLLVIYDWFSKYVIVKPMRAAQSQKLCDFLEYDVFLTHSVPQKIISDNGSQFTSKQFQSLLQKYNIKHAPNARYHSQHNPAERANGVIGAAIRCYLGSDHKKWDQELKRIVYAINTSVNAVTRVTPHYLVYGSEMKIDGNEYDEGGSTDEKKFGQEKAEDLDKARKFVVEQMKKSHESSKRRYDLRSREISYQPGEIVWRTNFQLSDATKDYSAKLGKRRIKCVVIRKTGNCCYELGDLNGKSLGIFHAKDICKN